MTAMFQFRDIQTIVSATNRMKDLLPNKDILDLSLSRQMSTHVSMAK